MNLSLSQRVFSSGLCRKPGVWICPKRKAWKSTWLPLLKYKFSARKPVSLKVGRIYLLRIWYYLGKGNNFIGFSALFWVKGYSVIQKTSSFQIGDILHLRSCLRKVKVLGEFCMRRSQTKKPTQPLWTESFYRDISDPLRHDQDIPEGHSWTGP